ncbi:hypothetical protein QTP86_004127 [Hemibagrus guttatus]|nr:hypothetical protein QTP86_004127 [Hemibagrus guttatus]
MDRKGSYMLCEQNQGISYLSPLKFASRPVSFYSKLYSSEWSGAQVVEDSFLVGLPKLSERAARELDRELSLEELHEALQRMENGRASGQDVLDVLRDSILRGELPLSCRRAVLTLLPKKGDLTHLKNWRPVSLLCTDYKLLSKAVSLETDKGQTEQVEAAGPEDVLQGANAGYQQPRRVVPLAQAGMRRSTAEPASKHPGPVGGLLLGRSTLGFHRAFSTCRKRKEGRGWSSYLAEPQPSDSSSSRDSSLDPET